MPVQSAENPPKHTILLEMGKTVGATTVISVSVSGVSVVQAVSFLSVVVVILPVVVFVSLLLVIVIVFLSVVAVVVIGALPSGPRNT